jgi:hypothetical protein
MSQSGENTDRDHYRMRGVAEGGSSEFCSLRRADVGALVDVVKPMGIRCAHLAQDAVIDSRAKPAAVLRSSKSRTTGRSRRHHHLRAV